MAPNRVTVLVDNPLQKAGMPLPTITSRLLSLDIKTRRKIYALVFAEGSEIVFDPAGRNDITNSVRRGQSDAFYATGHTALLLVCHQVYEETRAIYWAESSLRAGRDSSFELLSNSLSPFAMAHVTHLRSIAWETRMGHESRYILMAFASVKTVGLRWGFKKLLPEKYDAVTGDAGSIIAYILDNIRDRPLQDRNVQFLVDVKLSRGCKGCNEAGGLEHQSKHIFYNLSTGKLFVDDSNDTNTEYGLRQVTSRKLQSTAA